MSIGGISSSPGRLQGCMQWVGKEQAAPLTKARKSLDDSVAVLVYRHARDLSHAADIPTSSPASGLLRLASLLPAVLSPFAGAAVLPGLAPAK